VGYPVLQLLRRACPAASALALGAATIAPATTEAPAPLRVSASAAPAEVTYGSQVALSGRVEGQPTTPGALALEANAYPYRAWHVIASAHLQPDGSFAFPAVRPERNTRMRVLLEGTASVRSASVQVIVDPAVALNTAAPAPGSARLSVRLGHSPRLRPRAGSARWYLAPRASRRFMLAATTTLRELDAGIAYAAATVHPPARSFTYRVCVDAGWGSAMGPAPREPRCPAGDFTAAPADLHALEYEGRGRGIPLAPYPSAASIAAAERFLSTRAGSTAFATVDSAGRLAGVRVHDHFQTASVVKVMMLIAYLQMLDRGHRDLRRADSSLLYPMIHNSDNDAASAVLAVVGRGALARIAREVGMTDYAPSAGWWAFTQTSAADQARLMFALGRLLPRRLYAYARSLLAAAAPSHSWGIPPVARPRWRVYFKTGSLPSEGLFNEVARLERRGVSFSVAVLTTGDPSMVYGEQTIAGVGEALLARAPS
jgi:Beta-lactamase enzyme family